MRKQDFQREYVTRLLQGVQNRVDVDNHAEYRLGLRTDDDADPNLDFISYIMENTREFAAVQSLWADPASARLFMDLLMYRSLGPNHEVLSTNTADYREYIDTVETEPANAIYLERDLMPVRNKFLHRFDVPAYDAEVIATNGLLINFLFLKQYQFDRGGVTIKPEPGDVVLDCGASWGDTTVMFAKMVGQDGQVHAFEFVPDNVCIFELNLQANLDLEKRVQLCQHPVGRESGEPFTHNTRGPGTKRNSDGEETCDTISIDDYVLQQDLPRVDFIKMDIEGSEIDALEGAAATVKRWHPRLAISAYHGWDDLVELPRLIRDLAPGYELYLDHHTIHAEESVIYAVHP